MLLSTAVLSSFNLCSLLLILTMLQYQNGLPSPMSPRTRENRSTISVLSSRREGANLSDRVICLPG